MKKNILIFDNDRAILTVLNKILKHDDYNIQAVNSEQKAMEMAVKHDFDLIISDIVSEDFLGIELIDFFKNQCPEIKSILMTGNFFITPKQISNLNIDSCVSKPFNIAYIRQTVKDLLNTNP